MKDVEQKLSNIDDICERFPPQMIMIREVFQFSFAAAGKITAQFNSNAELVAMLEQLRNFVLHCELAEDQISLLDNLIKEEIEVVSFSQTSRSSVIPL